MKMKLFAILLLVVLSSTVTVVAQNVNFNRITGTVLNTAQKPFPFVYVTVKEFPQFKTATELNGTFILFVPDTIPFPFTVEFYTVGTIPNSHIVTNKNKSKKITIILEKEKPKIVATDTNNNRGERVKTTDEFAATLMGTKAILSEMSAGGDAGGAGALEVVDRASARTLEANIDMMAMPSMVPPPNFRNQPDAAAGLLTAGELNDFAKWTLWQDIAENELAGHQKTWRVFPNERYVAQLTNPDGMPIVDALVFLRDRQGNTIWQARTDNTGKAELWARMLDDRIFNAGKPYSLLYSFQGKIVETEAFPFSERINIAEMKVKCSEFKNVDIHFIVDATGSMGDEIAYLQVELYDVIEKFKEQNPHLQLRTGSVFYRDVGDEYLTRTLPLNSDISKTINFIKEQSAAGGGDYPEAVCAALFEAIENENWSENALARIAFLILDAPPHSDSATVEKIHRQIRLAAMKGIRIVPLVCSGADKSTEYIMRSIALATNGTYVFLTDESGIGEPHLKPTTDEYEVEKLNHILLRIMTEFSRIPNCNNNWEFFDKEISSQEKFTPKPYKENPEEGTERLDISKVISIYPNPTNGVLSIMFELGLEKLPSEMYITDATGKALQFWEFEPMQFLPLPINVNLSGYSNGVYFVNVFYRGRWYSLKFLLVR